MNHEAECCLLNHVALLYFNYSLKNKNMLKAKISNKFQQITNHLHSLAHPDTAEHSQRFFKTAEGEYGFGDKFLGIRVPVIRQAVKKFKATPLDVIVSLLKSEYHEIRLCALLMIKKI